jgi:hypothetical protein
VGHRRGAFVALLDPFASAMSASPVTSVADPPSQRPKPPRSVRPNWKFRGTAEER